MPVEIRELVVKITVDETAAGQKAFSETELQELKKRIIKECVDKVVAKIETQVQR